MDNFSNSILDEEDEQSDGDDELVVRQVVRNQK
jgi:hypothetical protein